MTPSTYIKNNVLQAIFVGMIILWAVRDLVAGDTTNMIFGSLFMVLGSYYTYLFVKGYLKLKDETKQ